MVVTAGSDASNNQNFGRLVCFGLLIVSYTAVVTKVALLLQDPEESDNTNGQVLFQAVSLPVNECKSATLYLQRGILPILWEFLLEKRKISHRSEPMIHRWTRVEKSTV